MIAGKTHRRRFAGRIAAAMLACSALLPCVAQADEDIELLEQRAFSAAADRAAPAVVRIETIGGLQRVEGVTFAGGPTTGLVVDPDGYIISSAFNFVNRPASILVRLPEGSMKQARLVATDHSRMLVLLKIDVEGPLPVPQIAPAGETRVGQWAIAVGRTFEADRPNMSMGVVSALGRIWGKAIQTDAAVSPNNYGGPLLDVRGRVLGVLVPLSPQTTEEVAGVQWYDSGIGFAVPAEHVMKVLPRLKKGEDLYPGVLGISLKGSNPSIGEPVITARHPNSPAAEAGLEPDDRIIEIDGREIIRAADVKEEISRRYAGEKVGLVVLRGEKRIECELELVAKLEPFEHPFLGILPMRDAADDDAADDDAADDNAADDDAQTPGVVVRYVYPGSPAAEAGIEPGDVLAELAGKPPGGGDQLRRKLSSGYQGGDEVQLQVRRGSDVLKLELHLGTLPEDLPPEKLPPARTGSEPSEKGRPQVGTVEMKVPEMKNDAWAYVPEAYHPAVPYGVIVWLHAPGGFEWDVLLPRWKPLCDRYDLILLAPKSVDPAEWQPGEVMLVRKLLDDINSTYTIDPARVVVCGRKGGGRLAQMVSLRHRDLVRAVGVLDAPLAGRAPDNEPLQRLAVYVTAAKKSRQAAANKKAIEQLREKKIPVTVKDLGDDARPLTPDETAELARWVDMLDRI